MKKGVILYYSWIGNTKAAAEVLQEATGYDLLRIEETKERKLGRIMSAAMCALFGRKSAVKPLGPIGQYDVVLLGTPVWAGKTPPAVNTFLSGADLTGKDVRVFFTLGDTRFPQKVLDSVAGRVQEKGGQVTDSIAIVTVWDPKTNEPTPASAMRGRILEWVGKWGAPG